MSVGSWRRHRWPIAGGLGGVWLSILLAWRSDSDLLTAGLMVLPVVIATGAAIVDAELRWRAGVAREAEEIEAAVRAIAAEESDELGACRSLAAGTREIMLQTPLWTDMSEFIEDVEWQQVHPGQVKARPIWSVDGIVERGAEGLRDRVPWSSLEQALGTHRKQLSGYAGTYSGRLSRDASVALEHVVAAADKAAEYARYGWSVHARATTMPSNAQPGPRTPDDQGQRDDAMQDARVGFLLALQNLQGAVERLERHAEPLPELEEGASPSS